jgi:hypothetical protein
MVNMENRLLGNLGKPTVLAMILRALNYLPPQMRRD